MCPGNQALSGPMPHALLWSPPQVALRANQLSRLSCLMDQAAKETAAGLQALNEGMAAAVALDNQEDEEVGGWWWGTGTLSPSAEPN